MNAVGRHLSITYADVLMIWEIPAIQFVNYDLFNILSQTHKNI
jgi:hypothetical protein